MPEPILISSRSNPRVKRLARLATRRGRRKERATIAVGATLIREAISGGLQVEAVFLPDDFPSPVLPEPQPRIFSLPRKLLVSLLELGHCPDAVAIVAIPEPGLDPLREPGPGALVLACGIQDPGNMGTIARSARFFGFRGLAWTRGSVDPWSPKVIRAAMGALLHSPPVELDQEPEKAIAVLEELGYTPVLLAAHGAEALGSCELPSRAALVLGEEGRGLPLELCERHRALTISGAGAAESLNVAAAFAVVAQAWFAAHGSQPIERNPS